MLLALLNLRETPLIRLGRSVSRSDSGIILRMVIVGDAYAPGIFPRSPTPLNCCCIDIVAGHEVFDEQLPPSKPDSSTITCFLAQKL